jgi:hypothetical protein
MLSWEKWLSSCCSDVEGKLIHHSIVVGSVVACNMTNLINVRRAQIAEGGKVPCVQHQDG